MSILLAVFLIKKSVVIRILKYGILRICGGADGETRTHSQLVTSQLRYLFATSAYLHKTVSNQSIIE